MTRTILRFGIISGCLSSCLMVATLPFEHVIGYNRAEYLGYTVIVLSFLLVFFGIRSFRDTAQGGRISFVQAFALGLSIVLVTCIFYVATWEIIYYNFMPDFLDKYSAQVLQKARAAGATPAQISAQLEQMEKYKKLYANPLTNAMITFLEPFPVGLVIALLSAAILRRKSSVPAAGAAVPSSS